MKRIFDEDITQLDNRPLPIECLVMLSRQDESETGEMDKNTARFTGAGESLCAAVLQ